MRDLTDLQKCLIFAALLNSALYLTGCFVAGMVAGNAVAWKLALATTGLCFLSYMGQYFSGLGLVWRILSKLAALGSIVAGVAAGVALLWRA